MDFVPASQATNLISFVPIAALLIAALVFWYWHRRNKTGPSLLRDAIGEELDSLKTQILLVTTDSIPGQKIIRTIGYIEALSEIEASSDSDYRLAELDGLVKLAKSGLEAGANAIVGIRKINASYAQVGSQWRIARVSYTGTAVRTAG